MKFPRYLDYSPEGTRRCESALLSIWAVLRNFHDDLVLIGGLVPRYLCNRRKQDMEPVTMDVDLGIAIGTSAGQYESVSVRLKKAGFTPDKVAEGHERNRLTAMATDGTPLILDLLTDKPKHDSPDSVQVEGLWVNAFPGIGRALQVYRQVNIAGHDLDGAEVEETVRVSEVGPFLCLKLNGYAGRAQPKDVFDMVYSMKNYYKGFEEAARSFREEAGVNPAYDPAVQVLRERFADSRAKGPVQYADFCTGGLTGAAVEDARRRLANEAVDAAQLLLRI